MELEASGSHRNPSKVPLQGFPTGPAALWSLLFQGGLAAILGLYVLFWLRLHLLQVGALIGLGGDDVVKQN